MLGATLCFASTDTITKMLTGALPAVEIAWLRYVIFTLVATPVVGMALSGVTGRECRGGPCIGSACERGVRRCGQRGYASAFISVLPRRWKRRRAELKTKPQLLSLSPSLPARLQPRPRTRRSPVRAIHCGASTDERSALRAEVRPHGGSQPLHSGAENELTFSRDRPLLRVRLLIGPGWAGAGPTRQPF
jgi:hypothetical protein